MAADGRRHHNVVRGTELDDRTSVKLSRKMQWRRFGRTYEHLKFVRQGRNRSPSNLATTNLPATGDNRYRRRRIDPGEYGLVEVARIGFNNNCSAISMPCGTSAYLR